MRNLITASAIGLALAFSAAQAGAAEFTSQFLNGGTTWDSNYDADAPVHYFYFDGARADQSYTGTGLASASSARFDVAYDYAAFEPLTFTFALNGQDIGDWTLEQAGPPQTLNFTFGPIAAGAGQAFSVSMRVTNGVGSGLGNVNFNENSATTFTLSGAGAGAVPEPATWAFMIMGFGAAGATLRRRRALAA